MKDWKWDFSGTQNSLIPRNTIKQQDTGHQRGPMRDISAAFQKRSLLEMFQVTSIKLIKLWIYSADELQVQYIVKHADVIFCPHYADLPLCYSPVSLGEEIAQV